ncbi:MAG: hypothetical protein M3O41_13010 [Pseudomonadota bacterium]|nr:hypothetical protein [Pseudomonadota bacterium]
MRNFIVLVAFSLLIAGCRDRGREPRLEPLARGLSEAMQPAYADFALEIRAIDNGSRVSLHCVLRNVSIVGTAITVDASTLPWRNSDIFDINAVAANGTVVRRSPPPPVLARISGVPTPLIIESGKSIEGDIDLAETPIKEVPRNEDLLLLWGASMAEIKPDSPWVSMTGVTFLKARSNL